MNLFNRIVVILLLLVLIPIVTVGLIVPKEAIQLLRDGLDGLENQFDLSVSTGRMIVRVGLALLIDGLLVFLLYLQLRRPEAHAVPVKQAAGGEAQIAISSIVERLEYRIDRLPGILMVKPTIAAHRQGAVVVLDVDVTADANMPAAIEEISTVARQVVEDEMGLKLKGKPKLNLRTVIYPQAAVEHPRTTLAMDEAEIEIETDESLPAPDEGPDTLNHETEDESGINDTPAHPRDEPTD